MNKIKILAFAGSLRKESTNKKTLRIAAAAAEAAGADVTVIDLKDYPLPIYDGDIESEKGLPENAQELQRIMLESQGLLIASPEYNSSVTGALKNMIDWTSRPDGDQKAGACYDGKAAIMMSASPGNLGGLRGLFDVRKILSAMGVIVLPDQVAVAHAYKAFDDDGKLLDEQVRKSVEGLGEKLADFLHKMA
ncbi:MAG: NAD(P)H-dependent oxidoreductase [Acidobacteriota bacterium]|nr:NAD(P)H-dependent oxidoreductase [Acidobacteriota bacterium]